MWCTGGNPHLPSVAAEVPNLMTAFSGSPLTIASTLRRHQTFGLSSKARSCLVHGNFQYGPAVLVFA